MSLSLHNLDLREFLQLKEDESGDDAFNRIRIIKKKTEMCINYNGPQNILVQSKMKYQRRDDIRRLLSAMTQNENIIYLDFLSGSRLRVPGSLIAEWMRLNKYTTGLSYSFYNNQSDFGILCNAIKDNNIVTFFRINNMQLKGWKPGLLGSAFRDNKRIKNVDFTFNSQNQEDSQINFLREMLRPDGNIQYLHLRFEGPPSIESANAVGDIITANNSLNTIKIYLRIDLFRYEYSDHLVDNILEKMVEWGKKYKLHINVKCCWATVDNFMSFLKKIENIQMEIFELDVNCGKFFKISEYVPKWKSLKELKVSVYSDSHGSDLAPRNMFKDQMLFAAAVSKNGSLERIDLKWRLIDKSSWHVNTQRLIDRTVARNKLLAKSVAEPENVPMWKWPYLLEMANEIGLDYLFQTLPCLHSYGVASHRQENED